MDFEEIKSYFLSRADELEDLSKRGDAWVFLGCSAMIDYLNSLINAKPNGETYERLIIEYLSQVRKEYVEFEYTSGVRDLPKQMYLILRCGLVHSFSLLPDEMSKKKGGRERSILLGHNLNGDSHFSHFQQGDYDAVVFTAEEFSKDIKSLILKIFEHAIVDESLKDRIIRQFKLHPPLVGIKV